MKYDFDSIIERKGTGSIKWDFTDKLFSVKDILPMWVADMDFRSPPPVIKVLKQAASHGIFGYAGVPESYRDVIVTWMKERHGWDIEKEWMIYTPGVVPALHMLVSTFSEPGDQVILQTPVYYPFFDAVKYHRREVLDNPLRLDKDQYSMDIVDLENKLTERTKMIFLCNPHNPVSRVWREDELLELGKICLENKILVIADEVHGDIVYPGFKHIPFASISAAFAENTITCTAASKTFNLPGLQTSNIVISNPSLRELFKQTVRNYGFASPNLFGIAATEAAYKYGQPWLSQLLVYLQGNIDYIREYINRRMPGLKLIHPQGTYLLWLDFRDCGIDASRLASFAREDARVGLEPGIIFGCKEHGFERMNIACPRSILEEGLNRLEKAVTKLRNT
ncbi:MAG: PatB family C-S lyase [Dehalococcoidia bacterium]|nr:PatB family C-S lyase [Dehalococcoidia bacterium]